jgi:hypothetical protein
MAIKWHKYEVEIRLRDRIVGGIPIIPEGADRADMYEKWARGQGVENDKNFEKSLPEALADDPDMPTTAEEVEGLETGFRRDENGLYIECRQPKAMLKEAAQRLGYYVQKRGSKQVLQHDLIVRALDGSQKLYLDATEPSGKDARPISVVTRQGPRTAIKRFEYATQPTLVFRVHILAEGIGEGIIDYEKLHDMLEFAQELGLGADRSKGEGTFDLIRLDEISDSE